MDTEMELQTDLPQLNAIVAGLAMAIAIDGSGAQKPVSLSDLTVPQDRLPADCALSTRASIGLRIATNPWVGTDRPIVASIRERVDVPPPVPDGPPLTPADAARFHLQLADGVEEAYAAVYDQSAAQAIVVYGLRFASATSRDQLLRDRRIRENPRVLRVAFGSILAVVHGDGESCAQAIGAYLQSLPK
jgi:hypothetical protein